MPFPPPHIHILHPTAHSSLSAFRPALHIPFLAPYKPCLPSLHLWPFPCLQPASHSLHPTPIPSTLHPTACTCGLFSAPYIPFPATYIHSLHSASHSLHPTTSCLHPIAHYPTPCAHVRLSTHCSIPNPSVSLGAFRMTRTGAVSAGPATLSIAACPHAAASRAPPPSSGRLNSRAKGGPRVR